MRKARRTFVGVVLAATAALVVSSASPAQAAPDDQKKHVGTAAAVDASLAPDRSAGPVVSSPAADAALAAIQRRIAHYVATHGTRYSFGSYVDPNNGRIVLNTDAPGKVVASLTDAPGMGVAERQAASQAQVRRVTTKDNWHRRDDIPAYYGGGGVTLTANTPWCSSGYTVQNSAGTRQMITAGHCFANGDSVLTESGANWYGTVSGRHLPTFDGQPRDMELIGGASYWGRIFTGGVTSSTSAPVVAAGEAFVNFTNYCHSGRTTGENCGHTATSITAQVCTQSGCKSPVIAFTGGNMIQGGDSGSPFYVMDSNGGAWIRGHSIASGGGTGYAEKWVNVAAAYGVSIVTG